jgi:hypothetical protein
MSQGNKLKFQRGAAANTEFEDRNKGAENRHHDRDRMVGPRKSLVFSAMGRFEQGHRPSVGIGGRLASDSAILEHLERNLADELKAKASAAEIDRGFHLK